MFRLVNLLVFITFLYSTVYAQSDDDFLSDFGGDDFEEIESELELVTTNVIKIVTTDTTLEKNPSNENLNWDGLLSQKVLYGLQSPSSPFLRRAPGFEAVSSNINLRFNSKIAEKINFKISGDVYWNWGDFESSKY